MSELIREAPVAGAVQKGFFLTRTLDPVYVRRRWNGQSFRCVAGYTPARGRNGRLRRLNNAPTTAGLNYLLNAGFKSGTTIITDWRLMLIDGAGYTAVAAGDTMASHAGWSEMTNWSGSDRPAWTPGTAASGELPGTGAVTFTIGSGGGSLRGVGLTSGTAKGATIGTLYATAVDSASRTVAASQAQQVFYTNVIVPRSS